MPSFGEDLRRERELREISLREISEATKINIRHLEALERNEFEQLPGGVFNRGFVRAYAEHIGIDPDSMVNAYLLESRGDRGLELPRSHGGHRMFRGSSAEPAPERPVAGRRRLTLAIVVGLLVAAAAFTWFWLSGSDDAAGDGPRPETAGQGVSP